MAAGLGYKEFATGDVLTAADANGYLASQVVMVFASAAARTSAIASPQEGMISYLKDTNATEYYSGSAWVAIGGSTSPLTTKGDLYTYSTTNARLGVGTNGQVLTADSAEATGLKWASTSGALTLVKTQTIGSAVSAVTVTDAFSATYDNYLIIVSGGTGTVAGGYCKLNLGSTTTGYYQAGYYMFYGSTTLTGNVLSNGAQWEGSYFSANNHSAHIFLENPYLTKCTIFHNEYTSADSTTYTQRTSGFLNNTTSYTAFTLTPAGGTISGGTIRVYGYQNS